MDVPPAPLTLEGSAVLHQMFRLRWPAWKALGEGERRAVAAEAETWFREAPQSAFYWLLGHKGDLLFLHFRPGFSELEEVERSLAGLRLWDFLEPTTSYLSVVELGLYDSSVQLYQSLAARDVQPESEEWQKQVEETLARQRKAMASRLCPEIPARKFLCFYPMDRKRGEQRNWYALPIAERRRQMHEHGLIGRRYAGQVQQIISGSIGFDDWEWGVDLFADDPLTFKKLIYEMRFDEASALYALFGPFYLAIRLERWP